MAGDIIWAWVVEDIFNKRGHSTEYGKNFMGERRAEQDASFRCGRKGSRNSPEVWDTGEYFRKREASLPEAVGLMAESHGCSTQYTGNVKVTHFPIILCRLISEDEDKSLPYYSSQCSPPASIFFFFLKSFIVKEEGGCGAQRFSCL